VVALLLGQSMWALNFWRVSPLAAGLWLLLIFYFFSGLAQQQLLGRLTRRAMFEFAAVVAVGLFVLLRYAS
jgi:ABC-type sulfate transport system permease subunit